MYLMSTMVGGFLSQVMKKYFQIGAIAEFSPSTVSLMLEKYDFNLGGDIVELGCGLGNVTCKILEKMNPESRLTGFEINDEFVEVLETIGDKRFTLVAQGAQHIGEHIDPETGSCVISTLPFTFFGDQLCREILSGVQDALKPGGMFILVQYSTVKVGVFKKYLDQCKVVNQEWNMGNCPPAKILTFQKEEITSP